MWNLRTGIHFSQSVSITSQSPSNDPRICLFQGQMWPTPIGNRNWMPTWKLMTRNLLNVSTVTTQIKINAMYEPIWGFTVKNSRSIVFYVVSAFDGRNKSVGTSLTALVMKTDWHKLSVITNYCYVAVFTFIVNFLESSCCVLVVITITLCTRSYNAELNS